MAVYFEDRAAAGRRLAKVLREYRGDEDVVVLGLPRGGIPVAFEVAQALEAPLDIFLVRKLGLPGHEELAMGAIASGGVRVLNEELVSELRIPPTVMDSVVRQEKEELERRERAYRNNRPQPDLEGKKVILVDDGLATGATMRAAVKGLRAHNPAQIIVAVPVGAEKTCIALSDQVDELICAETPQPFLGVGRWYSSFVQISDEEVRDLLQEAHERSVGSPVAET